MQLKLQRRCRVAFTLLEVMVALAIIAVALVAMITAQSQSMMLIEKARDVSLVTELARAKMAELELRFRDKSFAEIPEQESGTFEGDALAPYGWSYRLRPIEIPKMDNVAQKQGDQNVGLGAITDALTQSIRQLTLDITWKRSRQEQHYELVTFLTNAKTLPQIQSAPASTPGAPQGQNHGRPATPAPSGL